MAYLAHSCFDLEESSFQSYHINIGPNGEQIFRLRTQRIIKTENVNTVKNEVLKKLEV